jgi:hypothetical protein
VDHPSPKICDVARIWTEPYQSGKHCTPIEYWGTVDPHLRAPTLIAKTVLLVDVASFTFQFTSAAQLRDCLAYYERKVQPTSRRQTSDHIDHWEAQRWFERLPMYLLEDAKRKKVVAALQQALKLAEAPGFFERLS